MKRLRLAAVAIALLLVVVVTLFVARSRSAQRAPVVLENGKAHYGKTYPEWANAWLRWYYEAPQRADGCVMPDIDMTGEHCGFGQQEPDVFFLAGTRGGKVVRTACVVPRGRAIFFPIIVFMSDNAGMTVADQRNDEQRAAQVRGEIDRARGVAATIDGVGIDVTKLRSGPTQATYTFPAEPNFYTCTGTKGVEGSFVGSYDGYFVMLAPLSPGPHEISFRATVARATGMDFVIDVTYRLRVE
jgi:hypothetical protein